MNWLESNGGPILSLPTESLSLWPGGPGADYDLVCSIRDYAGVLLWKKESVLVLGDEHFPTALVTTLPMVCMIRWVHANSELEMLSAARRFDLNAHDPVERCAWHVDDSAQSLVDGSAPGAWSENQFRYELAPGDYEVRTYDVEPDPSTCFIYHAIVPVTLGPSASELEHERQGF